MSEKDVEDTDNSTPDLYDHLILQILPSSPPLLGDPFRLRQSTRIYVLTVIV